jgi:hypothetical protein
VFPESVPVPLASASETPVAELTLQFVPVLDWDVTVTLKAVPAAAVEGTAVIASLEPVPQPAANAGDASIKATVHALARIPIITANPGPGRRRRNRARAPARVRRLCCVLINAFV